MMRKDLRYVLCRHKMWAYKSNGENKEYYFVYPDGNGEALYREVKKEDVPRNVLEHLEKEYEVKK